MYITMVVTRYPAFSIIWCSQAPWTAELIEPSECQWYIPNTDPDDPGYRGVP